MVFTLLDKEKLDADEVKKAESAQQAHAKGSDEKEDGRNATADTVETRADDVD